MKASRLRKITSRLYYNVTEGSTKAHIEGLDVNFYSKHIEKCLPLCNWTTFLFKKISLFSRKEVSFFGKN